MLDILLLGAFIIICLHILHPSKDKVMQANALVPLYDVQEGESLPELCQKTAKLDA